MTGPKLEKNFENLLTRFPNLVSSELAGKSFREVWEFGEINVCVRQGQLPECNGRIDLAFITSETIHLIELKRVVINEAAVRQLWRYYGPLQKRYPNHKILGYLAGRRRSQKEKLESLSQELPFRVLLFGVNIPSWNDVIPCPNCGAGLYSSCRTCSYCNVTSVR